VYLRSLEAQEKLTRTKAQKEQPQKNQVIKSELEGTVEVSFKIDNGGKGSNPRNERNKSGSCRLRNQKAEQNST
jgi:hypothetical protein